LKLLYKKFGNLEPSHTYLVEPKDNLESENPKINSEKIMGEHRDQMIVITWSMSQGVLNLARPLHELPRKLDKILPKFDPDKSGLREDHLNKFFLATHLLNI
jgi:hypothetical protein